MHWEEQPVAIPQTFNAEGESIEDIFSGSAVVDTNNTSGFGTKANPPMVAIYTSAYTGAHPTLAGIQAQSLAYSLDEGQTWTKYSGNPVLDIGSREFRDPKVFWYAPAKEWRMVVVRAVERKVDIYGSPNLKDWTHLSEFGPAGAVGGVWECPDLFPLAVDGDPAQRQVGDGVNLNPGSASPAAPAASTSSATSTAPRSPPTTRRPTPRRPGRSCRTSRTPASRPGPPPEPRSETARPPATSPGRGASPGYWATSWPTASTTGTAAAGDPDVAGVHDQPVTTSTSWSAAATTRTSPAPARARAAGGHGLRRLRVPDGTNLGRTGWTSDR